MIIFLLFIIVFSCPSLARAEEWTPVQLALWHPAQIFSPNRDVYGFRWNIVYGKNKNVSGMDIGGYNAVDGVQKGIQCGLFNFSKDARGMDVGLMNYSFAQKGFYLGLVNHSEADVSGIQAAFFFNSATVMNGFQIHAGILGNTAADVMGGQVDLSVPLLGFNYADSVQGIQLDVFGFNFVNGDVQGVQIAPYNTAREVFGIQLGLFNFCEKMHGIQIGLLNAITRQKPSIMPIVNVGF